MDIQKIWDLFSARLHSFILNRVHDQAIADDLLQDVFVKMIHNWEKVLAARDIKSYIHVIARNTIIDHMRNNRDTLEYLNSEMSQEEESSLNEMIASCIKPLIAELPSKYSEALLASEFEGMSQKELAKHLQISYSGAKSRVQRGREKLKSLIEACCFLEVDVYGNIQHIQENSCEC